MERDRWDDEAARLVPPAYYTADMAGAALRKRDDDLRKSIAASLRAAHDAGKRAGTTYYVQQVGCPRCGYQEGLP